MNDIDVDLDALVELTRSRASKPRKYHALAHAHAEIAKAMMRDVSLPVLLSWLRTHRDVDVSLNTLRKYIVISMGRAAYDDYIARNGWRRARRQPRASQTKVSTGSSASQSIFTASAARPRSLIRTERSKNEKYQSA